MHAKPDKNRAPMIRYPSQKQLSLVNFDWPFQTALDKHNRWVKLSACIPWDELAMAYYQSFTSTTGRPIKDARLVIGALIVKHQLCLSDRETLAQIQENPYLQYFVGLPGYQMEEPFAPSVLVEIRKRMGQTVFDAFQGAIIDSVEAEKRQRALKLSAERTNPRTNDDDSDPPSALQTAEGDSDKEPESELQGKLILDATVAPQAIRYPTDLSLLNEAREISEKVIDKLHHANVN